jgi:hypothetical protein
MPALRRCVLYDIRISFNGSAWRVLHELRTDKSQKKTEWTSVENISCISRGRFTQRTEGSMDTQELITNRLGVQFSRGLPQRA